MSLPTKLVQTLAPQPQTQPTTTATNPPPVAITHPQPMATHQVAEVPIQPVTAIAKNQEALPRIITQPAKPQATHKTLATVVKTPKQTVNQAPPITTPPN